MQLNSLAILAGLPQIYNQAHTRTYTVSQQNTHTHTHSHTHTLSLSQCVCVAHCYFCLSISPSSVLCDAFLSLILFVDEDPLFSGQTHTPTQTRQIIHTQPQINSHEDNTSSFLKFFCDTQTGMCSSSEQKVDVQLEALLDRLTLTIRQGMLCIIRSEFVTLQLLFEFRLRHVCVCVCVCIVCAGMGAFQIKM